LHGAPPPGCPKGCIWTKQIRLSLCWFRNFFRLTDGFIQRDFDLKCYLGVDKSIELVLDASPWGLGGIMLINGTCDEYFSSPLSSLDTSLFQHELGSPNGQQVWECLCALVALRLWRPTWGNRAMTLRVKGDSMSMLSLIVNLRTSSPQLSLIGREIAMEYAQAVFVPVQAVHIPGIANTLADELSRRAHPGHLHREQPHLFLRDARQRQVPARDKSYYVTLNENFEPVMRA